MGTDELARSQHTCEFLNIGEAAADQLAAGFANQREHLWVAVLVVLALYIYIYIY
jgi:hypothetical protein